MSTQLDVAPYDLTRPPVLKAREQAALQATAAAAAAALGAWASEFLGSRISVRLQSVGETEGSIPAHPAGDRSLWVVPSTGDSADGPVWRFDRLLASNLVDVMIGCQASGPSSDRALSNLDGRLVCLLCEELHTAWTAVWPRSAVPPESWRCITESPVITPPPPHDWVRIAFDVSGSRLTGRFDIYLPVALARLPTDSDGPRKPTPVRVSNPGVQATPVTASVRLATWHTTLRRLLSLQDDEIIPLGIPADATLSLSIGGAEKLPVRPGTSNGRIAVQVVEPNVSSVNHKCLVGPASSRN